MCRKSPVDIKRHLQKRPIEYARDLLEYGVQWCTTHSCAQQYTRFCKCVERVTTHKKRLCYIKRDRQRGSAKETCDTSGKPAKEHTYLQMSRRSYDAQKKRVKESWRIWHIWRICRMGDHTYLQIRPKSHDAQKERERVMTYMLKKSHDTYVERECENHDAQRKRVSLQRVATHCNSLQHTATYCNTLQHTATHCNTL